MGAGEKIAADLAVLPQRHGRIRFKNQFLHTFQTGRFLIFV